MERPGAAIVVLADVDLAGFQQAEEFVDVVVEHQVAAVLHAADLLQAFVDIVDAAAVDGGEQPDGDGGHAGEGDVGQSGFPIAAHGAVDEFLPACRAVLHGVGVVGEAHGAVVQQGAVAAAVFHEGRVDLRQHRRVGGVHRLHQAAANGVVAAFHGVDDHVDRRVLGVGGDLVDPLDGIAEQHVDGFAGAFFEFGDVAVPEGLLPDAAERRDRQVGRARRGGQRGGAQKCGTKPMLRKSHRLIPHNWWSEGYDNIKIQRKKLALYQVIFFYYFENTLKLGERRTMGWR